MCSLAALKTTAAAPRLMGLLAVCDVEKIHLAARSLEASVRKELFGRFWIANGALLERF